METFIEVVKKRKRDLCNDLTPHERTIVLATMVDLTLKYKISGNMKMFDLVMK